MKACTTRRARLLGALVVLGACSDPPGPGVDRPLSEALVSSAIVAPGASRGAALLAGQAYVSMLPRSEPAGLRVEIRNLRNGDSVATQIVNGGYDPVAVQAEAEDTLAITVVNQDGTRRTAYAVVPRRSRPKVVRTSPPSGKTDVPLNSILEVVFNEPMDSASLPGALRLQQAGLDVPGTVSGVLTDGILLGARFAPTSPLASLATHDLSVSSAARSLEGEPLDRNVSVQFTTQAPTGGARLRVVHAVAGVGRLATLIDGDQVAGLLRYLGTTGYLPLTPGSHDVWYQVDAGTMDQSLRTFVAGTDYTVLPCCAVFPLGGFLWVDDNSAPPAGHARIRVIDYASLSPSVRIYVTAPGAPLVGITPVTINVTDATAYLELPAGDYQVRITAFDRDVVEVDSGILTLLAGQVRTLVAVDAASGGPPYGFLVLPDRN